MSPLRIILQVLALSVAFSTWAGDDSTLRVISVDPPPPYSLGTTPPETVVVEFNQPVLESSIHDWTVRGIGYDPP